MFRGPERLMRRTARRPVLIQETLSGESQAFTHWSFDWLMFQLGPMCKTFSLEKLSYMEILR